LSPEELEKIESAIPEWKKGAVVMRDVQQTEESPGLLGKMKNKVSEKISNTQFA
jgi:hypothetical protein